LGNIQQEKQFVNRGLDEGSKPLGNVSNAVSERFFYGKLMTAGAFATFSAGGHVGTSAGTFRLLRSGPADVIRFCRRCCADLRGVLHSSRINFRSEKVCRSFGAVMCRCITGLWAEGVCRPYSGGRIRVSAPLMFKHRPGISQGLKSWGYVGGVV
jgi:hypothetical protein